MRSFQTPMPDLNGASIMVTGGTGSFGHCFVRTLLDRYKLSRLIVYSRDELKQFEMQRLFSPYDHPCLRYFIGDVRDRDRLAMAMRGVDIVLHAAALKHVPVAEYNPFECIRTNVIGAENVVQASIQAGVRRVIALSTDKAANPINLYGASKLASDKIFVAANHLSGQPGPRFSVVRYGNVMNSRGSLIEMLTRLKGTNPDSVTVTDPRMSRFWITLQQGVDLVISSLELMIGGEIFVPKIPSMMVVDLINSILPGVPHKVIGIRPGEKLHEVMITADDARSTIELPDRYVIEPSLAFWERGHYQLSGGHPVGEDFFYASNHNAEWLEPTELHEMLAA